MKKVILFSEISSRLSLSYPLFSALNTLKSFVVILFIMFLVLGVFSCEKHLKIPQEVSNAFWAKYENATNIEWTSEQEIYNVKFDLLKHPKSATFKEDGEWVETISTLQPKDQ